jgi:hypothetical protein
MPYINQNSSNPIQGMIRINGSMLQVFDGSSWVGISNSNPTVTLSGTADSAIQWALNKMAEEAEFKKLAETNVTVKHALADVELAKEKLKVIATLAKEDNAQV